MIRFDMTLKKGGNPLRTAPHFGLSQTEYYYIIKLPIRKDPRCFDADRSRWAYAGRCLNVDASFLFFPF
jgi:hypothetical protein